MPALEKAKIAVASLKPGDITEIKAMKKGVPPIVEYTLDAVAVFFGQKLDPVRMAPEVISFTSKIKGPFFESSYNNSGK